MFIVVNAQLKTESNRFYICIYRLLSALTDLAEINNIHLKIIMSVLLNVWSIKVLLTLIVVDGPNLSAIYIYIYMGYWPSFFDQDGWVSAKFLFCVLMEWNRLKVHKLAKKRTIQLWSHLQRTNLVNIKGFIGIAFGEFFFVDHSG